LLRIKNLKVHFPVAEGIVRAIDDIDVDVDSNQTVAIVGESGCGKTMTALSVMRLIPRPGRIVNGEIRFRGRDLLKLSQTEMREIRGGEISMIFQDPMTFLNPVFKVGDQIAESIVLHHTIDENAAKNKAVEAIGMVGIPTPERAYNSYPHQLSGGMRQRILIAMSLVSDPSLLIADEPTTALDVTTQAQILQLLKEFKSRLRTSILLITHDLGIVADLADTVYVMYAGNIVEHADVFSLYRKPLHPYTAALLRSILSIDEFAEELVTIEGSVPSLLSPPKGCKFHPRCSKRLEICNQKAPAVREVEENHYASCWLHL
jgi:oligopeptide/dipeptide ABC transporter ATP-binding protein